MTVTMTVVKAESATSYMHQPKISRRVTGGWPGTMGSIESTRAKASAIGNGIANVERIPCRIRTGSVSDRVVLNPCTFRFHDNPVANAPGSDCEAMRSPVANRRVRVRTIRAERNQNRER